MVWQQKAMPQPYGIPVGKMFIWLLCKMQFHSWFVALTHSGKMLHITRTIVLKYSVLLRLVLHILLIYDSNEGSEVKLEIL